ncbi:ABC transporter permease [Actinoallomurus rhizosphaericola]|uniref:ABC transporter permease n=1 Tax=Actinoallomurus rhizosphaericola TaxID=2952536 RepID=UPI002093AFD0|nr:FtsX-like permease family protein [Actinoallomurus rhizosphaericola]MCO5994983.1 ABC transporter permease [Actinoallomurus rhizosphaericola]
MGRILLVFRLVLADVRRHPGQAVMLLVSITAATAMLSVGMSLNGATETLYRQTRAATAGPDFVAFSPGTGRTATSALTSLAHAPEVVAHSGPYRQFYTTLTAHGATANVVMQAADATPGPTDRPLVTSGTWVRPGGVVIERGFANALGVHVGDHVTVAGHSLPLVGIAVTAAYTVYPFAQMGVDGLSDYSGLVWLNEPDTRALVSPHMSVTSAIYLKLRDPAATGAFLDSHRASVDPTQATTHFVTWQDMAVQDSVMLKDGQPILVIGSWLLCFLAIAGVATLAAGRAARQTRRVGLLKAVGATPGLIAAVLLAEYLTLVLLADALGLTVARLTEPTIINPTASLITAATGPTGTTIAVTTIIALAVAALTTLGPTIRALRTETVTALADTAHQPQHRAHLTRISALLPTPLLLGLRLIARRPGRAFLHACTMTAALTTITALLMEYAQPARGYGLDGSPSLTNLKDAQGRHLMLAVTAALITLAVINTITITWTTAQEARPTMAIARTLGATPGQITAGLSVAQLLPTLPGALAGIPLGIILCLPFTAGNVTWPPAWSLLTAALAALPATAALTAIPARIAARRSVAQTLSAEAT